MKHYAFCSFGKDSLATVLLALQHGEPLDGVIYCETMYDHKRGISAEMPEHIEWIYKVAKPRLEAMGANVIISRSPYDMLSLFHAVCTKGKTKGMKRGYPMQGRCYVEGYCKLKEIHRLKAQLGDFIEYVGIAADELPRLKRLKGRKVSLMAKYGVTEAGALQICKDADLLSPTYDYTHRGGCFFCPSATYNELHHFSQMRPDLWEEVLSLSATPGIVGTMLKWPLTNDELRRRVAEWDKLLTEDADEEWREIENTDGQYLISSKKRVFSKKQRKVLAYKTTRSGSKSVAYYERDKRVEKHIETLYKKHFKQ